MIFLQNETESGVMKMLGFRIATQRKRMGISQTQLAKRLHISPSAIGMYEQGRREPSAGILVGLAKELGVSVDYLLTGKDYSRKYELEQSDVLENILEMYMNQ